MAQIDYSKISKAEMHIIEDITRRAVKGVRRDPDLDFMTMMMDIEAVHSTVGLRLDEFLKADEQNFWHDIYGIRRHLNRDTLELEDCFLPRFAQPESGGQ